MRLCIEQTFPLGRFHATPWKVFPYDDPHGEWPPSPWRLLRAILARSFQFERETGSVSEEQRAELVRAFGTSTIEWHLPDFTWRGPNLRQYQPAELGFTHPPPTKLTLIAVNKALKDEFSASYLAVIAKPKGVTREYTEIECFDERCDSLRIVQTTNKELLKSIRDHAKKDATQKRELKRYPPDFRIYNTTKVQDNFWLTATESNPVVWFIDGKKWTSELSALLSACLDRLTYFGRAESINQARLVSQSKDAIQPNCFLSDRRSNTAVPVLCWKSDVELGQALLTTDEEPVAKSTTPPGAIWRFAERPPRRAAKLKPAPRRIISPPVRWIQFALGSRIPIYKRSTVMLTQRFRGIVLKQFLSVASDGKVKEWRDLPPEMHERAESLTGKDVKGNAISGHRHPLFFLHFDDRQATRLCVWRAKTFEHEEQQAFFKAAVVALPLTFKKTDWAANLIPLDRLVPPPPAISDQPARIWESMTPYVPPRHIHDRRGKEKPGESVIDQVRSELSGRGFADADVSLISPDSEWIKVHRPSRGRDEATNDDKRGYQVRIIFAEPQSGPVFLGNSCHFGLGLFVPVVE